MIQEDFFDFVRRELDATPIYEFPGAPLDEQISVSIDRSDITGTKPAAREALLINGRIAEIRTDEAATADDDFALAIGS
jgi:hypothetical protein